MPSMPSPHLPTLQFHNTLTRAKAPFAPIDPAATYTVVTNDFLRKGGDGYAMFRDKARNAYDAGPNLEDVLA
jgi:5'-nucleotidase